MNTACDEIKGEKTDPNTPEKEVRQFEINHATHYFIHIIYI